MLELFPDRLWSVCMQKFTYVAPVINYLLPPTEHLHVQIHSVHHSLSVRDLPVHCYYSHHRGRIRVACVICALYVSVAL